MAAASRHVRTESLGFRLSLLKCRKVVFMHVVCEGILLNDTSELDDRRIIVFRSFTLSFAVNPPPPK